MSNLTVEPSSYKIERYRDVVLISAKNSATLRLICVQCGKLRNVVYFSPTTEVGMAQDARTGQCRCHEQVSNKSLLQHIHTALEKCSTVDEVRSLVLSLATAAS